MSLTKTNSNDLFREYTFWKNLIELNFVRNDSVFDYTGLLNLSDHKASLYGVEEYYNKDLDIRFNIVTFDHRLVSIVTIIGSYIMSQSDLITFDEHIVCIKKIISSKLNIYKSLINKYESKIIIEIV